MKVSKMVDIRNATERYIKSCEKYNKYAELKNLGQTFYIVSDTLSIACNAHNLEKLIDIPSDIVEKLLLESKKKCYDEMRNFTEVND